MTRWDVFGVKVLAAVRGLLVGAFFAVALAVCGHEMPVVIRGILAAVAFVAGFVFSALADWQRYGPQPPC